MKIDVSEMNDSELLQLFDSLGETNFRSFCRNFHGLTSRVRGWRDPTAAPFPMLKQAALSYSHGPNRPNFLRVINDNLQAWDEQIDKSKKEAVDQGIDEASAYALAVADGLNPEFRDEYFHLKKFDSDFALQIQRSLSLVALIEKLSGKKENMAFAEEKARKNSGNIEEVDKKAKANADTIESLKKANQELEKKLSESSAELEKLSKRVMTLESDKATAVIQKRVEVIGKKENDLDKTLVGLRASLETAKKDWDSRFEKQTPVRVKSEPPFKSLDESKFEIEIVHPGDFSADDGSNLDDIVGDVSGGLLSKETREYTHFGLYKDFVLNCLYGDRLLFAEKSKAIHLTKVLSGILTGQGYCEIECDSGVTSQELYQFVSKRINDAGFSIFLINGFLGREDFYATAKKLRALSGRAKFVFSISDVKAVRFLSPDILDDFLFFDASINFAGHSEYVYICQLPSRPFADNGILAQCLKDFGVGSIETPKIISEGLGFLRYSYLPFFAYRDDKTISELAELITDETIQNRISGAIDD